MALGPFMVIDVWMELFQAQKTCFSTLRRLVDIWGGKDGPSEFTEFVYKQVVPACFLAPLRETFDLNDAQTAMALSESALCLKAILDKRVSERDGNPGSSFPSSSLLPESSKILGGIFRIK